MEQQQSMKDKLTNKAGAPQEGIVTKEIENVTARIPSGGYLSLAIGSMVASAGLAMFSRKKTMANFIGLWVPTLMLIGIYNKIVKVEGSDRQSKNFEPSQQDYH